MKSLKDLKRIVKQGLKQVRAQPGLIEGLVYASSNRRTVGRIVYTSHIPCNGLEEPKSDEDFGISVELWFKQGQKKLVGIGQEPSDLSVSAVHRAIEKAKRDAVEDKDFTGFLKPEAEDTKGGLKPGNHDEQLLNLSEKEESQVLARLGWETITGAVDAISYYAQKRNLTPKDLAFILNGDNFIIRERMALATTNGILDTDETTVVLSFLTAMLEKDNSKGSSWGARMKFDGFSAYEIGKRAALAAINGVGGVRVSSGTYPVVFGSQAVTELFGSLLLPHLSLGMVDFGATIFTGKYGQKIASELLTLYDDATLPEAPGSKRITCEGCPTGKTLLIDKGRLVGFLSDSRTTNKILGRRNESAEKLGVDPHDIRHAISPRNGFRFARGGGRIASSAVGIHATNLVVDTHTPLNEGELLEKVKHGVYIGRLWYTYPVGGYASGIISGTAIADCFKICDGKLAEPILPNTLRLEDHLGSMIHNIIGIGGNQIPTILWASDEITHAPWVAVKNVNLLSINEGSPL